MVTKEILQRFIDSHANEIAQILPGGLKNKEGKWLLVCPIMERFDLDFSNVAACKQPVEEKVEEVVETIEESVEEPVVKEKPKKKRSKKK